MESKVPHRYILVNSPRRGENFTPHPGDDVEEHCEACESCFDPDVCVNSITLLQRGHGVRAASWARSSLYHPTRVPALLLPFTTIAFTSKCVCSSEKVGNTSEADHAQMQWKMGNESLRRPGLEAQGPGGPGQLTLTLTLN